MTLQREIIYLKVDLHQTRNVEAVNFSLLSLPVPLEELRFRVRFKLHSDGLLLAARIDILPFSFLKSRKKEIRAIKSEKRQNADSRS